MAVSGEDFLSFESDLHVAKSIKTGNDFEIFHLEEYM